MLQIVDRQKLLQGAKEPTPENLLAPQVGRLDLSKLYGAHTSFPLPKMRVPSMAHDRAGATRDLVMVVGETRKFDCATPRQVVLFADVSDEQHPVMVSSYTVPDDDGRLCSEGAAASAHTLYKKFAFISHFNAGVRALDIRDPYRPREVGYFIPAATDKTCAKANDKAPCVRIIQTNNVETDERGYVYIVDRANTGMHILEVTGEARKIANFPRKEAKAQ